MKNFKVALFLVSFLGFAPAGISQLISKSLFSSGNTLLTYDSGSGLEWVDITQTLNKSVASVDVSLSSGGAYFGFRRATSNEFTALFTRYGVPYASSFGNSAYFDEINYIQGFLGYSFYDSARADVYALSGFLHDGFGSLQIIDYSSSIFGADYYRAEVTPPSDTSPNALIGHFLVRETNPPTGTAAVPEPSTYGLFAAAILALSAAFLRRTKRDTHVNI